MGIMLMLGVSSCRCTKEEEPVVEFTEATIAADRAQMDEMVDAYKWFETRAEYDNFFDADTTLTITKVESLFQVAVEDSLGVKTFVYDFVHFPGVEDLTPDPITNRLLSHSARLLSAFMKQTCQNLILQRWFFARLSDQRMQMPSTFSVILKFRCLSMPSQVM